MPRGKRLTEFERGQITELRKSGCKLREIARRLKRSVNAINQFVNNPDEYGTRHSPGRPKALSERDERKILRLASNSRCSIKKIRAQAGVAASRWTVWRTIKNSDNIVRAKAAAAPKLDEEHKQRRITWAEHRIQERLDWTSVIFSDEKKFNLDGPDGYGYYWHDLRKSPEVRMSRVLGGGGVMLWACIGMGGVRWAFVEHTLNAEAYFDEVLRVELVPFGEQLGGPQWIFQQDGAKIHESAARKPEFQRLIPRLLEWPSRSPDLNPVENVWGIIVNDVYNKGRQFDRVADLREAIIKAFNRLDITVVQRMIADMPNRVVKVVANHGARTGY